jgi:hypothetical protein
MNERKACKTDIPGSDQGDSRFVVLLLIGLMVGTTLLLLFLRK